MKKNTMIILSIVGVLLLFATIGISTTTYVFHVKNESAELRNAFDAQVKANQSTYDKTWKIISQKAKVASKYSDDFRTNYSTIMKNRYGNPDDRQSSLMLWIQEKNPEMSTKLYESISRSIEALRNEFDEQQKKLIDIKREHDNLRTKYPSKFVLDIFGEQELKLNLVTSTRTEKAFDSGKDDDVSVGF